MLHKKKTVFAGMSGGVDSSVAALLLKRKGYDVVGVFLRCYNIDGCAEQDAEDARRVAGHLGIPFYVWDFEEEYKKKVVEYMVDGYRRGLTPNPDVECNREIKFGLFYDRARELGADYVATGHYVKLRSSANNESGTNLRIENSEFAHSDKIRYSLMVAENRNKDQSYFLWTLTQKQLAHCLFPIGDYLKSKVRAIARKAGLPTAEKKDSQGICFLGKVSVADFLKQHIPSRRGAIITTEGVPVGEHDGASFYTIGQRHIGLGYRLSSFAKASAGRQVAGDRKDFKPFYVAEKNVKANTLTVAEGENHPALYRKELELHNVNFIAGPYSNVLKNIKIGGNGNLVFARVRYRQPISPAVLTFSNSRELENRRQKKRAAVKLVFDKPQKFVAPGQSAVFYTNAGEMIGGGVIV